MTMIMIEPGKSHLVVLFCVKPERFLFGGGVRVLYDPKALFRVADDTANA